MSSGENTRPVCLLTGASGTFGRAFWQLASDRYAIAAVYNSSVPTIPSQETAFFDPLDPSAEVDGNENPVFAIQADLTTQEGCEWAVKAALDHFGCIDVLVHAAARSVWGGVLESDVLLESAAEQFEVNVLAALRLAAFVGRLDWKLHEPADNRAANRNVVMISSTAGIRLYEGNAQSVYGATKAALNHLSCQLADEFDGIGVRVNALAPESFPVPIPVEDVVDAALALATSNVTGNVLVLDLDGQRWMSLARRVSDEKMRPRQPKLVSVGTEDFAG